MNRPPFLRLRPLAATFVVTALGAGCTSILGDFSVSNNGGGSDGGGDGTAGDGATNDGNVDNDGASTDSPASDAPDAADFLLKCDGFKLTTPLLIDSLASQSGSNRSFGSDNVPAVVTMNDQIVHVVMQGQGGFTFYTIDKQNPNNTGPWHQPLGYRAQEIIPVRDGTGIMVTQLVGFQNFLGAIDVPRNQPVGNQLPAAYSFQQLPNNSNNRFSSAYLELTPGSDYFYAFTDQQADAGANLFIGRTFADGGNQAQVDNNTVGGARPIVMRGGPGSMYVFMSSDPSSGGAIAYKTPDDARNVTLGAGRRLSGTGTPTALMIAAAASPTPNQFDIAMVEFDPNSTTALATFRIGSIDGTKLDTFKAPDLPKNIVINDTTQLPIDKGVGAWFGDEFTMLGKGSPATFKGVNFMWFDAQGHTRAMNIGANSLLNGEAHPVNAAGMALSQRVGTRYVTFNVVWTETLTDADSGGDYDVLYLNELVCH